MDELELLIIIAVIAVLVGVLLIPYLFFSHLGLKSKVANLERVVSRLQAELTKLATPSPTPTPTNARAATPARALADETTANPVEAAEKAAEHISGKAAPLAATSSDAQISVPTPWPNAPPETIQTDTAPSTPKTFVFKPDLIDQLLVWLRENWVLAVAAASLALAGLFMVQYGIENGLLTPFWRVMGAFAFGAALIAGGEYIRRTAGLNTPDGDTVDGDTTGATKFLPSTLSGAGIIVLYIAVFSARALYGLIGSGTTLMGLSAVSVVALVLGWFYGPFLAAVGVLGASLAPFIVGGGSNNSWMVHYYLALVAATALGIDTIKRWAWVSALGLGATLLGNGVLFSAKATDLHFLAAMLLIALATHIIPERALTPRQSGASLLDSLLSRAKTYPEFPTRLTLAATTATSMAALVVSMAAHTPDTVWLAITTLTALLIVTTLWTRDAPGLYDHVLIPALAFLALIATQSIGHGPLFAEFWSTQFPAATDPAATPIAPQIPLTVWVLSALAALGTVLMFARMHWAVQSGAAKLTTTFWALCAATFAPATLLLLEFMWGPRQTLGPYPWALAAMAMAALLVLLASRANTATDGARALRTGLFAVGALTLITLAVFLVLTKSALTIALAVMVLGTCLLDRRTPLPPLTYFIQLAVAIITFRLVIWPGMDWALSWDYAEQIYKIGYFEVAFTYLGTLGLLAAAWWVSRGQRLKTALVLESAVWTILGIFLTITLIRIAPHGGGSSHWVLGAQAAIWAALALNQAYRMQMGGRAMTVIRIVVAGVYTLVAGSTVFVLLGARNPLWGYDAVVQGPPIFDSLAMAFLPLAAVFAVAAWKITHFGRKVQIGFILASIFFATLYTGMEIRRLWRGTDLAVPGFSDPELYTYTLAMLITSVGLLILAFSRRSDLLRKVAMGGVALTIAKVFLVDMSGLSGLIRVFSFMGLGLSLVALTWLNRKMTAQWERGAPRTEPGSDEAR